MFSIPPGEGAVIGSEEIEGCGVGMVVQSWHSWFAASGDPALDRDVAQLAFSAREPWLSQRMGHGERICRESSGHTKTTGAVLLRLGT